MQTERNITIKTNYKTNLNRYVWIEKWLKEVNLQVGSIKPKKYT